MEFLGRLEHGFRAECCPGGVAGEQHLEFTDDLLGGGFGDQFAFDLQLEALLEERDFIFAGHTPDGSIVGRASVGIREPDPHKIVTGLPFEL